LRDGSSDAPRPDGCTVNGRSSSPAMLISRVSHFIIGQPADGRCAHSLSRSTVEPWSPLTTGNERECSLNVPIPSRTFELGRVGPAGNRLISLKAKLSTKMAQFPACGENGRRERKNEPQARVWYPAHLVSAFDMALFSLWSRRRESSGRYDWRSGRDSNRRCSGERACFKMLA
jgi:hypothetical protein